MGRRGRPPRYPQAGRPASKNGATGERGVSRPAKRAKACLRLVLPLRRMKGPAVGEVTITVCTTCRKTVAGERVPAEPRPGALLHAALAEAGLPGGVRLRAVECLSACSNGCSVALTGGDGRWSYIYGNLDPVADHVGQILEGAAAYAATGDGLIPWRERPPVFRKQVLARIPPQKD